MSLYALQVTGSFSDVKAHTINGYSTFVVKDSEILNGLYGLRHQVYCDELKWVEPVPSKIEVDEFDTKSIHFAVTNPQGSVIATIRTLDMHEDWFVDQHFSSTLSDSTALIKQQQTVEASRLAINPEYRQRRLTNNNITALDMLLTCLIDYSSDIQGREMVLITTTPLMGVTLKRRGVAIRQVGPILTMVDGCKVASFMCDLEVTKDCYRAYQTIVQLSQ
jgi:N-acyl-L-homoserine lactone synthetase